MKKQVHEIEPINLGGAIETLFDHAVSEKNIARIYSIQSLCSDFFSEDTRNESLLFTLRALILSYEKDSDPKRIEDVKFIMQFTSENEKLKALL